LRGTLPGIRKRAGAGEASFTPKHLVADLAFVRSDHVWHADITCIRLPASFVYLACVPDGYSRRRAGRALSRTVDTALPLTALELVLASRRPAPGELRSSCRRRSGLALPVVQEEWVHSTKRPLP
jgi:hypothetical protein